jgi:hypothetical protein
LRLAIELGPGDATLCPPSATAWLDVNAFHRREVNHQPAVDGRAPGHIVTATTNRQFEAQLAGEVDRIDHVGHATTSGNQSRMLVHQTIMNPSGFVIPRVRGLQELPRERVGKLYDCPGNR